MISTPIPATAGFREEADSLGTVRVPADALYGVQTQRALENFPLTGATIRDYPEFVESFAMVKQAAAIANKGLGLLDPVKADAIIRACERIIAGEFHDQFVVDLIQGGAGTSTNMNANEVIANLALEILGRPRGSYDVLSPLDDVNMSQSTNDVYPTAARIAIIRASQALRGALQGLAAALEAKSKEFHDVIKLGRTQLQDAVPMTLELEFQAFAVMMTEDHDRLREFEALLAEVNLGGTAIGTRINAPSGYQPVVLAQLRQISGVAVVPASHLVEATSDPGAFVLVSAMLKRLAVKLSKIANDLRLLNSGPAAGLNEINLPKMQPGSSIMPGKINPVIPEAVNQACFEVMGNDVAITLAAQAGQLQLNAMTPLIVYKLLASAAVLRRAVVMFTHRCIEGITANRERCREYVDKSAAVATILSPYLGYEAAARVAKLALESNRTVIEVVRAEKLMDEAQLGRLLSAESISRLADPGGED
jgi:aspartate ammonia-lyase